MSCTNQANRIAKWAAQVSAGISQLSSKQAFLAGAALGAASTGLGAVAFAKRKAIGMTVSKILGTNGRNQVSQIRTISPRPGSAKQSGRPRPKKSRATTKTPKPIPALAKRSQETKLKAGPIKIQIGQGQSFTTQNGYRVLRPDGSATGLAITPHVRQGEKDGQPVEDTNGWGVSHINSGTLLSGPYQSVSQAQTLASQLASLRWTKASVPPADVNQAKQIIQAYQQSLG